MAGELDSVNEMKATKNSPVFYNGGDKDLEGSGIHSHAPRIPFARYIKKVGAEMIGTFFLVFSGCGSIIIDKKSDGSITHLGVSLVFGITVMILIYSLGHVSGGHFNPAITLGFSSVMRFPLKDIVGYIAAQFVGSIAGAFVLRLLFGRVANMGATVPTGSDLQSFALEFLITFLLMFVVCSVATDTRAIGEMAGLAVGATIAMTIIIAGPISGGSLNPARSMGSALAGNTYTSIWIYLVAPTAGAIAGGWAYEMLRLTDEPVRELTKSGSFLKSRPSF